jgi:hypothetical protein
MSDQFPATKNTVMMTAPAILEWLEGEIEDVNKVKATRTNALERGVYAAIAGHLQNMSDRFAATAMRGLDGDTTAARPIPRDKP